MSSSTAVEEIAQHEPQPQELRDVVAFALRIAGDKGVDQAEAAASHDTGLSATARLGEVESLEYTNDRGVGVTVYVGQRKGSASTSDFPRRRSRRQSSKPARLHSSPQPDEHAGLADGERMAGPRFPI